MFLKQEKWLLLTRLRVERQMFWIEVIRHRHLNKKPLFLYLQVKLNTDFQTIKVNNINLKIIKRTLWYLCTSKNIISIIANNRTLNN